jgi:hypothetical protein
MPALALKAVATLLTLGAAAVAAAYVTAHVKNPTAPLHPTVLGVSANAARGGRLHLTPQVQGANVAPVTSTYAS